MVKIWIQQVYAGGDVWVDRDYELDVEYAEAERLAADGELYGRTLEDGELLKLGIFDEQLDGGVVYWDREYNGPLSTSATGKILDELEAEHYLENMETGIE